MKRRYLLSGMAIASVIALGAPQGRADSDVDGMDHSHLNHGVFGAAAQDDTHHHTDAASSDVSFASLPPPLEWKSPSR